MLFNSSEFLAVFLPATLAGYWLASRAGLHLWFLVAASFAFYGYWDWRFEALLVPSIVLNWTAAQAFLKTGRRWILHLMIVADLTCLGIFKYAVFFSEVLGDATGMAFGLAQLALPLGISFFTFHHIIYLVDLLRGRAPSYSLRDYALYIVLFPQLIAGPLVRHSEIIHQFALSPWRDGVANRWSEGFSLLVIGLAKKMFLANQLAPGADQVFDLAGRGPVSLFDAWYGVLSFTFQIYFDFSAYSDMAIGIALLFGFRLPINFDAPYRALNVADFWRRWHMTLSRFLRDYLYIPLGGNRRGLPTQVIALMITMVLGGLWHGAGWPFIIWGLLHGAALSIRVMLGRYFGWLPAQAAWLLTFLFVAITWVFFRAPDIATANSLIIAMLGAGSAVPSTIVTSLNLQILAIAAAFALIGPTSQIIASRKLRPWMAYGLGLAAAAIATKIVSSPPEPFIYFQF
jgi:D-alanyl-lipoteichoic acid acyltransferase DltB (MBOAT superfamily)